jgi:site-specific recombinase XerD
VSDALTTQQVADLARISELVRLVRQAVKYKSYLGCPVGVVVAEYLRWKQMEVRAAETTIRDYEIPLAYLCLDHPTLELEDFEPPTGRKLVREFMDRHWGTGAPAYARVRARAGQRSSRTVAKNLSILSDFFNYCVAEDLMRGSPTVGIARPKKRDSAKRRTYALGEPERIIAACGTDRERCAVAILVEFGLRKSEVAGIRLRDYDSGRHILTVTGKGSKNRSLPVVNPALAALLDSHWMARLDAGDAEEFLLYPQKWGPRANPDGAQIGLNWEDKHKQLSPAAMHYWWKRKLAAAGVPHTRKMHEMRHTAATDLLRSGANLELVRQMLGHADIKTTAMYAHLDMDDLALALKLLGEKRAEEADA